MLRGESSAVLKFTIKDCVFDNITVRGSIVYSENLILNVE